MKRYSILAIIVAGTILLVTCNRAKSSGSVQQPVSPVIPAASAQTSDWYFAEFERLGFSVFRNYTAFPKIAFYDFANKQFTIDDFAGKIVLFNIWATWCPPCKMEMPSIQKLHDAKLSENFVIVAVSTGEKSSTVSSFIKENKYSFPVFLDPTSNLGSQLASRGIPTTYIIDKKGRVIAGTIGARAYDGAEFMKLIERLSNE